jgi:hypothetical protein
MIKTAFKVYATCWIGGFTGYGINKGHDMCKSNFWLKPQDEYSTQERIGEYFGKTYVYIGSGILGFMCGCTTLFMPQLFLLYNTNDKTSNLSKETMDNIIDNVIGSPK